MDTTLSWTDIVQAIAACIAVPGALAAFYVLIKKDKARESEIKSLSEIANQLTQMMEASENRYKSSKKPHLEIEVSHELDSIHFRLEFKNTNRQSTIKNYNCTVLEDIEVMKLGISEKAGLQSFTIHLQFNHSFNMSDLPAFFSLNMEYITDDNYVFLQDVYIVNKARKFDIVPFTIIEKTKSSVN